MFSRSISRNSWLRNIHAVYMNLSEGSTGLYIVILWEVEPGSKSGSQSARYSLSTWIRPFTGLFLTEFLL